MHLSWETWSLTLHIYYWHNYILTLRSCFPTNNGVQHQWLLFPFKSIRCCCQLPQYNRSLLLHRRHFMNARAGSNGVTTLSSVLPCISQRDLIFFLCWREANKASAHGEAQPQQYSIITKQRLWKLRALVASLCVWITRKRPKKSVSGHDGGGHYYQPATDGKPTADLELGICESQSSQCGRCLLLLVIGVLISFRETAC